jgi:hypothetical protein
MIRVGLGAVAAVLAATVTVAAQTPVERGK